MIRLKEKHRTFTNAFRIMAIKLEALPGVMAKDIAEILEIHPFMLSRWKKLSSPLFQTLSAWPYLNNAWQQYPR
ncbi:transposase [Endozoicomonas atrinae]|uniref:transposase n=1 Tax=Endozoicomonas atrinae TaxID=1333660 RepID=UPI0009F6F6C4